MRPDLIYLDEALERGTWARVADLLLWISNGAFAAFALPYMLTTTVRWQPSPQPLFDLAAATGRPLIYYWWHAYSWLSLPCFRNLPSSEIPALLAHDGWRSRINQRACLWFGLPLWVYRRYSASSPRKQITEALSKYGGPLTLAADSGGPYGRIKQGLLEVAQASDAFLIPVTMRARRALHLRRPVSHYVPLPFCSLTARYGEPLDARNVNLAQCQEALDRLERDVSA